MRVDRNAAAVVAHRDGHVRVQFKVDLGGVAGHGLVHGVVEGLGREMVQRRLVGPADVHARPAPHRFQPFQDLDVLCCIFVGRPQRGLEEVGHGSIERCGRMREHYYIMWPRSNRDACDAAARTGVATRKPECGGRRDDAAGTMAGG